MKTISQFIFRILNAIATFFGLKKASPTKEELVEKLTKSIRKPLTFKQRMKELRAIRKMQRDMRRGKKHPLHSEHFGTFSPVKKIARGKPRTIGSRDFAINAKKSGFSFFSIQ